MDYTEEQKRILAHDVAGHACILAGPGTGKSTTVIALVTKLRTEQSEVTVKLLTFTRAANLELMAKIESAGIEAVGSSTVHSFAISVLLRNPGTSRLPEPIRIADDREWDNLVKPDLASRVGVPPAMIERLKNEMSAEWESLAPDDDSLVSAELRGRFKGVWDVHREIFGYSLLSELPFRLKGALEGNPTLDIGHLDVIAVDEYQDLNACDIACIRLLSERGVTVIAIGDDDQSIYRFRKAHPEGIRNFPAQYGATSYPLTISQRLGKNILEWANYVIAQDTQRRGKVPVAPAQSNPPGACGFLVFADQDAEIQGVPRLISWLRTGDRLVPAEEILLLARTDVLCSQLKSALRNASVDYSDSKEALDILGTRPGRLLLNLVRLMSNSQDSLAWWDLLQSTPQIGRSAIDAVYNVARAEHETFGSSILAAHDNGFASVEQKFRAKLDRRVSELLSQIEGIIVPDEALWGNWLVEQVNSGRLPDPGSGMRDLLTKLDVYQELATKPCTLSHYINRLEPTVKDFANEKTPGKVRIMSMRGSKGLTVKATILIGAEDNIIPHKNADEQEERRLLYVAMTRSTNYLFITRARTRTGRTARISRANVGGIRNQCRFLEGGPVTQEDAQAFLRQLPT